MCPPATQGIVGMGRSHQLVNKNMSVQIKALDKYV